MNVLKPHVRTTVETLLERGESQREIERRTGVDRKTIRRYARAAKSPTPATGIGGTGDPKSPTLATGSEDREPQNPPPRPPGSERVQAGAETPGSPLASAVQASACAEHRSWIEAQVRLGRNAMSIYQDLVETRGFTHAYGSVKRFVRKLRSRDPERFDVLEFLPGEEAQVDFGLGALTLLPHGRSYKRPWLFVMTLKYSGKSFRTTVWKADQETWARLHEQAFHAFGGCPQYVGLGYQTTGSRW